MKNKNSAHGQVKGSNEPRMVKAIRSRADYSLAILGMAFVRNGSGRFLNIRTVPKAPNLGILNR